MHLWFDNKFQSENVRFRLYQYQLERSIGKLVKLATSENVYLKKIFAVFKRYKT